MPGYKGHLFGGSLVYGLGLYLLQSYKPTQLIMVEWLVFTLAGALFPDIDVKSKGQKLFYWVVLAVLLLLWFKQSHQLFVTMSIMATVPMLVKHRGLFHRLWFVIGFPLCIAMLLANNFPMHASRIHFDALFFIAGAVSHLWLDLGVKRMLRF